MKAPPTTEVCQPVVVAMYFNYLGYHSVIVDLFVYASAGITLVSSLHYIRHASRIIESPQP